MIEQFLKNSFPIEYSLPVDGVIVPIERYNTPFTLSDIKSCNSCKSNPQNIERLGCNEEILRVNNNGKEVAVVNFEQYISQFQGTAANVKDRCDILMVDSGSAHQKIVFCDICCYAEKYVEPNTGKYPQGKRAKARQQMKRSIDVLLQESLTAINILTYTEKICLFAWRDYDVPDMHVDAQHRNARSNVQAFSSSISNLASQTTTHYNRMEHDFSFMQIKYPSEYKW